MNTKNFNIAFFASHGGSNMQAIIDATKSGYLKSSPRLVISNNSDSQALKRAESEGIQHLHISTKTHPDENDFIFQIQQIFDNYDIDLVVLAGYMKKLHNEIIQKVNGRVLNIHPALLPKFGGENMYGMNVHRAVIQAGEKISGATVHLVDSEYDRGRILNQKSVPVLTNDTPETLAERVLEIEHILYPETIFLIENSQIII